MSNRDIALKGLFAVVLFLMRAYGSCIFKQYFSNDIPQYHRKTERNLEMGASDTQF
ncbi:MAG: hypothetical protein N2Z72_04440 [Bacteroidales bacterium]|nr:hypothetical protein [Bacteroidales bacterium]